MRPWKRRLGEDSGGTLVETALSIFLLLTFMFGLMEGALAIYSYHFISNAAREGTRYAIVRGSSWSTTSTTPCSATVTAGCTATAAQIETYVTNLSFPGIDTTQLMVTPQCANVVGVTFGTFALFPELATSA